MVDQPKERDVQHCAEAHFARGRALQNRMSYAKAIDSFDKAIELVPDDYTCLLVRGYTYLEQADIPAALKDAEKVLSVQPKNAQALLLKAEAYYVNTEFEEALKIFHRGKTLRPDVHEFDAGIEKTSKVIGNCCSFVPSLPLTKDTDLTEFNEAVQKIKEKATAKEKSRVKLPTIKKKEPEKVAPLQMPPMQGLHKHKATLEGMYNDRTFFNSVFDTEESRKELDKSIKAMSASVRKQRESNNYAVISACIDGANYLDRRSYFWYRCNPACMSGKVESDKIETKKVKKDRLHKTSITWRQLMKRLKEIQIQLDHGLSSPLLHSAQMLLNDIKAIDPHEANITERTQTRILGLIHSIIGSIHLANGRLGKASMHHIKDLQLAECTNELKAFKRAMSNLAEVAMQDGRYYQAVEVLEMREDPPKEIFVST